MSEKKPKKSKLPATQTYLPIAEIRDGVVVLKDGTLRSVLLTSSINFALKSDDEQSALISGYVGFLNSLDFPIQIVIQSRRLHIQPYLDKLGVAAQTTTNELMRVQMTDYRAFVSQLVELGQIMTKQFYVVVPYDPLASVGRKSFFMRLKEVATPAFTLRLKDERFKKRKEDLDSRVRQVTSGLASMGLSAIALDTQALIELYYSTYNPNIAFAEGLGKMNEIRIEEWI